jgi:hypothetical protein
MGREASSPTIMGSCSAAVETKRKGTASSRHRNCSAASVSEGWPNSRAKTITVGADHLFPALAHRPGGVDFPYFCFIRPLEMLGLIWNVKHMHERHRWDAGAKG